MVKLSIKVKPGSFKDEILFDEEQNLVIKIREKPIEGAANKYLIQYLAKEFGLSKNQVVLEKGSNSPFKRITLDINEDNYKQLITKYKSESAK